MAVKSEQQILNDRAREVGHRIENLKTLGHYHIHKTGTRDFYIVKTNAQLRQLIINLEKEHNA